MIADEPMIEALARRTRAREADRAARSLIARAAHLEKRAERPRVPPSERTHLNARARELRTAAELLLTDISEVSRSGNVRSAA
jgi:hypothetical protein